MASPIRISELILVYFVGIGVDHNESALYDIQWRNRLRSERWCGYRLRQKCLRRICSRAKLDFQPGSRANPVAHKEELALKFHGTDRHRRCDWRREVVELIADWNDQDYLEHV